MLWHSTAKKDIENPGGNSIFENSERENNVEVEKVGRENSVILNHVNLNHININSNNVNYNKTKLYQLFPDDSTTVNDLANIRALNLLL